MEPNEAHRVELPEVGERPDSSWPSEYLEGGGPRHSIFVGDKDGGK